MREKFVIQLAVCTLFSCACKFVTCGTDLCQDEGRALFLSVSSDLKSNDLTLIVSMSILSLLYAGINSMYLLFKLEPITMRVLKMKKIILLSFSIWFIGCASTRNIAIDASNSSALKGKSLILVKRKSPSFIAMTSGKGMFAVAGVGAAASAGNKLVKEKNIEDPALSISQSVAKILQSRYDSVVVGTTKETSDSGDIKDIATLSSGHDYALDVVTNGWSFIYDGFNFSSYLVGYSAKLRLIDIKTAKVLSEGLCVYDWKKAGKKTVTYEELLENNAAVIKTHLSESIQHCTEFYDVTLFKM